MKKDILLKKTILTCSLAIATALSCSANVPLEKAANHQQQQLINDGRRLESNTIYLTLTPLGALATQREITLKEGDELAIEGKVIPSLTYAFESIEAVFSGYQFLPVLLPESDLKQNDSGFSFRFRASVEGKQTITFTTTWSKDGNFKSEEGLAAIDVNVTK